jgi:competence protein ComEA
MHKKTVFLLRIVTGFALLAASAWTQDLPPGSGRAETEHLCKQCHELARVTSLRQDRDAWAETMAKMKAFGMKATDQDFALVLDYLSKTFPAGAVSKINVNTATAIELESGLTLRRSQSAAIIAYRKKNGPFKSLDDLKKVPSIDGNYMDEKKDRITF